MNNEHYKISEAGRAKADFRRVFNVNEFAVFYDGLATAKCKRMCIDPIKFDAFLHEKYGDYEAEGKSMQDIVLEKYGTAGVELMNKLM